MQKNKLHSFILIFILVLLNYFLPASAQNFVWAKGIGTNTADQSYAIAVDGAGNVYVTGYFNSTFATVIDFDPGPDTATLPTFGKNDIFLAKYDANGNYLWAKSMGGSSDDYGYGVAVDGAGNVYVTGHFSSAIADFNPGGNGGSLTCLGGNDAFLAKYDANGNYLWAKNMGGTNYDQGRAIAVDNSGNVYLTGYYAGTADFNPGGNGGSIWLNGTGASNDVFLAKYNTNGNCVWANSLGGSGNDQGLGITLDNTGNVYITGFFNQVVDFNPGTGTDTLRSVGGNDIFIAKYNSNGNYIWAKNMGGSGVDYGQAITTDGTGNVYISGYFSANGADFNLGGSRGSLTSAGRNDAFVAKYDANGNYLWANSMGGSDQDYGYGIAVDGNSNVYVTGYYGNSGADFNPGGSEGKLTSVAGTDVFVAKYDMSGNFLQAKSMGGAGNDQSLASTMDASGNLYVTGTFPTPADFAPGITLNPFPGGNDVFIVKLSPCESHTILTQKECDSFTFNEVTYTASGVYTDTFISSANCDSIITLDLTISHATINPVVSGHYCDSVTFNGITYTSTGVYTQSYPNALNCDSNIIYDITIAHNSISNTIQETTCDSFVFNDTVYTATNTYLITFTNAAGCDSIVALDLTVKTSPVASVIKTGTTLTTNNAESYQWINCTDNSIIAGAVEQSYTVTQTGNYAVIVTSNNCSDTSECILVEIKNNSINELEPGNTIELYPNPTHSQATIQTSKILSNATIRLVNVTGQYIEQHSGLSGALFTLNLAQYAAGIYFVEVSEQDKTVRLKLIKE